MRFLKNFLLMVLASAFLVACGGGGGDSGTSGGGSNVDSNLAAAYGKISGGMTFAQVKAIVGTEPSSAADAGGSTLYSWQGTPSTAAGAGTLLGVVVNPASGVKQKFFSSPTNPYSSQNY
jgi:hypothetical protein